MRGKGGGNFNQEREKFVENVSTKVAGGKIFKMSVNLVAYIVQITLYDLEKLEPETIERILATRRAFKSSVPVVHEYRGQEKPEIGGAWDDVIKNFEESR